MGNDAIFRDAQRRTFAEDLLMHEYSIVQALLDSCEQHAKANNAAKITQVVLKVGVMSGVEPQLLQSAFDTFKEATICQEAALVMHIQEIVVYCRTCHKESTLKKREYLCPACQSNDLEIRDGEEMYLMQLEMEENS